MNNFNKDIFDEEGREFGNIIKESFNGNIAKRDSFITKITNTLFEKFKGLSLNITNLPAVQKITGRVDVDFPDVQKVEITNQKETQKVQVVNQKEVKFPETWKVELTDSNLMKFVKAIVGLLPKHPETQKVEGRVVAEVSFPDVQKVEVNFPETQKVEGKVRTDIPVMKLGNQNVIPIVYWDGKRIVDPMGGQSVGGDGKLYAAIKELQASVQTQSVFHTGQVLVTASGNFMQLGNANIKTVVVQALKDNRGTVYVSSGNSNDYELQPGQPVTVVIDNLSKIKVGGSYTNDGVCYTAS